MPTASSDFHGPTHKTFSRWGAYDTYGLGEPAGLPAIAPGVRPAAAGISSRSSR